MKDETPFSSFQEQLELAIKAKQEFDQIRSEHLKSYHSALAEYMKLHNELRASLREAAQKTALIMANFKAATDDYNAFQREFYKYTSQLGKTSPACQHILDSLQINEASDLNRTLLLEAERIEKNKMISSKVNTDIVRKLADIKSEFNSKFDSAIIGHSLASEEVLAELVSLEKDYSKSYQEFVEYKTEVLKAIANEFDNVVQDEWKERFEKWDIGLESYLREMTEKRRVYERKCLLEREPFGESQTENNNSATSCDDTKCTDFAGFHTPALEDLVSPLSHAGDVPESLVMDQSTREDMQTLDELVTSLTPTPSYPDPESNSGNIFMPFSQLGMSDVYGRAGMLPPTTPQPPVQSTVVHQSNNRPYGPFFSISYQGHSLKEVVKIQPNEKIKEITCLECPGLQFKTEEDLLQHEKTKHQKYFFKCDLCNYLSASKREKAQHYLNHATDAAKLNACQICFNVQRGGLTQHMTQHHYMKSFDDMDKEYCTICHKKCEQRNLFAHMEIHRAHKVVREAQNDAVHGKFLCYICDKKFHSGRVQSIHMLMMHNVAPFSCSVCKANFYSKGKYDYHRLQHTRKEEMLARLKGYKVSPK